MPQITQEMLEEECRRIAKALANSMPTGCGFILSMFNFGPEGSLAYMSSANREDAIRVLRELVAHIESRTN